MPKHLLNDMVANKNLSKPKEKVSTKPVISMDNLYEKEKEEVIKYKTENAKENNIENNRENFNKINYGQIGYSKKRSHYFLWFVAFISVIFLFFAISFLYAKAGVKINPKIKDINLSENFVAGNDPNASGMTFDTVVISGDDSKTIPASGFKNVSLKATGKVIIYNNFSSVAQVLNINSKLEGSNGKIYKTDARVTVPGKKKDGTPGQVNVSIYGETAGEDYNSDPLDFKFVNFNGTAKYTKIYARSDGAVSGGFVGNVPDISDADKLVAENSLQISLKNKLLNKAIDQIPAGFILFKDAIFLNNDDLVVPNTATNGEVTLTLKGTLYGILFNEKKLTQKIATDNVEKYDGSDIYIPHIRDLVFSLSTPIDFSVAPDIKNINFSLSGPVKIVWKVDTDQFTKDLLGKNKTDFNQVLAQYQNIDSAVLVLSPAWKMSIPSESKKINVIVNYPE